MEDTDIGVRLRRLREARKLSQRQLAARAGVTNGMISMIEQAKVSPSVANLKKILDGLPISLAEFFGDDVGETKTFWKKDEMPAIRPPVVHGPDAAGAMLSLLRLGRAGQNNLMLLHETYDPGADTGPALYSHESEEAGIIVSGTIEITVGEEVMTLGAGDGYIFDSRRPHRFHNNGTEPCVLISACTPPTF